MAVCIIDEEIRATEGQQLNLLDTLGQQQVEEQEHLAESVVNAQLIIMSRRSKRDESMKFPISRRLLAKHKFDYVANSICQAAARDAPCPMPRAPCHSSMSQGRLTQCIWEPTRCAHTHTHTHTYRDRANCIREWPAKVCGSNKMDALKTRANLEKLCPFFLFRILRTIFTVYTSNGKSGKKLYAIPRKEPVDALLKDTTMYNPSLVQIKFSIQCS